MERRILIATTSLLVTVSGCTTNYVANGFGPATYQEVLPYTTDPIPVRLECEVHRHNERKQEWDQHLRREVVSILEATGVFVEAEKENRPERLPVLRVVTSHMESRSDRHKANAKYALLTVPTLGAIGTHLKQPVNVNITLQQPNGDTQTHDYPHEVHLYGGQHHPPEGCERVPAFNVHEEVAEDALLQFLSQYRRSSSLANVPDKQ